MQLIGCELAASLRDDQLARVDHQRLLYTKYCQGPSPICPYFSNCLEHDRSLRGDIHEMRTLWVETTNEVLH
jgi:hypothetical protein